MPRRFICQHCPKEYATLPGLRRHLNIHSDQVHHCSICNKSFKHKENPQQHLQSHNERNNHVCQVCGKCYRYRIGLYRHIKMHTKEKTFSCETCDKTYVRQDLLRRHVETHQPKKECEKCKKSVHHMEDHLKICGKKEQNYSCSICCKRFKLKRYLREHIVGRMIIQKLLIYGV